MAFSDSQGKGDLVRTYYFGDCLIIGSKVSGVIWRSVNQVGFVIEVQRED